MNDRPNFGSILDRQASEIERPKPLPVGTYHCMIVGQPRIDKSKNKGTEFSEYTLKFIAPGEDVDEDDLKSALTKKSGESVPLQEKTTRVTYYHTDASAYRLLDFLKACGIDVENDDRPLRALIADTPNCELMVHLKHTPSDDGESIYANVDKVYAVES